MTRRVFIEYKFATDYTDKKIQKDRSVPDIEVVWDFIKTLCSAKARKEPQSFAKEYERLFACLSNLSVPLRNSQLSNDELDNLRSHFGTSSWGGIRYFPMAFTEQGVAMLSSILNSDRAILVNIHVMRVFARMRTMLMMGNDVLLKLERLERSVIKQDTDIKLIFVYLKKLLNPKSSTMRTIGFKQKAQK